MSQKDVLCILALRLFYSSLQAENCSFEITPVSNSNFYKSNSFKNSSNKKTFNHLSIPAYPLGNLTQHLPVIKRMRWDKPVIKTQDATVLWGFLTQILHCASPAASPRFSRYRTLFRSCWADSCCEGFPHRQTCQSIDQ